MFNPYRALTKSQKNNLLTPVVQHVEASRSVNDKDFFGDNYFFNGGFWAIRRETFLANSGSFVFSWLGDSIGFVEQDPIYQELDAEWQLQLVDAWDVER